MGPRGFPSASAAQAGEIPLADLAALPRDRTDPSDSWRSAGGQLASRSTRAGLQPVRVPLRPSAAGRSWPPALLWREDRAAQGGACPCSLDPLEEPTIQPAPWLLQAPTLTTGSARGDSPGSCDPR